MPFIIPLRSFDVGEKYLFKVAVTIKDTFPKSSTKEVERVLHGVFLGICICQLTEERSASLEQKRTVEVTVEVKFRIMCF